MNVVDLSSMTRSDRSAILVVQVNQNRHSISAINRSIMGRQVDGISELIIQIFNTRSKQVAPSVVDGAVVIPCDRDPVDVAQLVGPTRYRNSVLDKDLSFMVRLERVAVFVAQLVAGLVVTGGSHVPAIDDLKLETRYGAADEERL